MRRLVVCIIVFYGAYSCSTTTIEEVQGPPLGTVVTYVQDVSPIVSNNCLSCHQTSQPNAGLNLETYQLMREATENGNVLNRINNPSNPMPSSGLMAPELRAIIQTWADNGFIEN